MSAIYLILKMSEAGHIISITKKPGLYTIQKELYTLEVLFISNMPFTISSVVTRKATDSGYLHF